MEDKPKRPRGRPPAPPESKLTAFIGFRATEGLKAKVDLYGDPWAREALEKAPPPKAKKAKPPKD